MQTLEESFKYQIDNGATEVFCYGIYDHATDRIEIKTHRGPLSEFPSTLYYIRTLSEGVQGHDGFHGLNCPLFVVPL
jgi:hypothetical protein